MCSEGKGDVSQVSGRPGTKALKTQFPKLCLLSPLESQCLCISGELRGKLRGGVWNKEGEAVELSHYQRGLNSVSRVICVFVSV